MHLIRLFYVSKAREALSRSDISDILEKSRRNNEAQELTGVLCFKAGRFAQILEGEELALLETYVKIARDKRHADSVIISVTTTARRLFERWAMGMLEDDSISGINMEDLLTLRNAPEQAHAGKLMQHWLTLLESAPGQPNR